MKPKNSTSGKIRKMLLAGIPLATLVAGTSACTPEEPHVIGIAPYIQPKNEASIMGKYPVEPEKKQVDKIDHVDKTDKTDKGDKVDKTDKAGK